MIDPNNVRPRSLEDLSRRQTRYEVVAFLPDARVVRLGFSARVSRVTLLELAIDHREQLLPFVKDYDGVAYSRRTGLQLGALRIAMSGRTERDCALEVR